MKIQHNVRITLTLYIGVCLVALNGCSRKGPGEVSSESAEYSHEDIRGDCLDNRLFGGEANGSLILEVHGNDLHMIHADAFYQCCLGYRVEYEIDDFNITAIESDINSPCLCDCHFNLLSILYDLAEGLYVVTLIGIDGDTVGVDSAFVGG